ncbi:hypothetical protein TRIUR3_23584 [Triticum urartu]|uniref:Abscisic acid receptor PYL8 n=2 Tax=Triticeae TaxID=147389 RepID=M7YYJ7_TRIUA|nr:hypothetical protein TRIUR3_23584 [Triticum urartu]
MGGLVGGGARAWRLSDEAANGAGGGGAATEADYMRRLHGHAPGENQCTSALVKHIKAPVHLVWSLVRSFDQPQRYKPFVSRCVVRGGDLEIGSVREVNVKTGLPATTSTERLEQLDDDEHILSVKFVGGDHRLRNYSSIITVHPQSIDGRPGTLVIESFVVDVPDGNTKDETCYFVEAVIKCNLTSLAEVVAGSPQGRWAASDGPPLGGHQSLELGQFGGWRWEVAPEKSEADTVGHDGGINLDRFTLEGMHSRGIIEGGERGITLGNPQLRYKGIIRSEGQGGKQRVMAAAETLVGANVLGDCGSVTSSAFLIQQDGEVVDEFRQHDDMVTVMVK